MRAPVAQARIRNVAYVVFGAYRNPALRLAGAIVGQARDMNATL